MRMATWVDHTRPRLGVLRAPPSSEGQRVVAQPVNQRCWCRGAGRGGQRR